MNAPQTHPRIVVVAETRDFRRLAQETITVDDVFLEIGCSFGECTKLLGELGFSGTSLDHSADAVAQARRAVAGYPGISVVQTDVRDTADVFRLCPQPSVILFDVGGSEPLDKVFSLLRLILKTFRPRCLLVRSIELAELSSMIQEIHLPDRPRLLAPSDRSEIPHQLIELSRSPVVKDRLYAIQRMRRSIRQADVRNRMEELCVDESPGVRKQARHALKLATDEQPISLPPTPDHVVP